jgi:hypothetical protein
MHWRDTISVCSIPKNPCVVDDTGVDPIASRTVELYHLIGQLVIWSSCICDWCLLQGKTCINGYCRSIIISEIFNFLNLEVYGKIPIVA